MSGGDDPRHGEDPDRAAILARRQRFVSIALSGLTGAFAAGCEGGKGPDAGPQPCLKAEVPAETQVDGPTTDATSSSGEPTDATEAAGSGEAGSGAPEGTTGLAETTGADEPTGAEGTTGPEGTGDETGAGEPDPPPKAEPKPQPCLRKASPRPCLNVARPREPAPKPCLSPPLDPSDPLADD